MMNLTPKGGSSAHKCLFLRDDQDNKIIINNNGRRIRFVYPGIL